MKQHVLKAQTAITNMKHCARYSLVQTKCMHFTILKEFKTEKHNGQKSKLSPGWIMHVDFKVIALSPRLR